MTVAVVVVACVRWRVEGKTNPEYTNVLCVFAWKNVISSFPNFHERLNFIIIIIITLLRFRLVYKKIKLFVKEEEA